MIINGYDIKENSPYRKYLEQGLTLEEAKQIIRNNNKSCKDYWVSRGFTLEEATKIINSKNPTKVEYWL
jgi:hypothetical protein